MVLKIYRAILWHPGFYGRQSFFWTFSAFSIYVKGHLVLRKYSPNRQLVFEILSLFVARARDEVEPMQHRTEVEKIVDSALREIANAFDLSAKLGIGK